MGSHSAPHSKRMKENASGMAGIYNAHASMELYAEIFEAAGKLDYLEVVWLLIFDLTVVRTLRQCSGPASTLSLSIHPMV